MLYGMIYIYSTDGNSSATQLILEVNANMFDFSFHIQLTYSY